MSIVSSSFTVGHAQKDGRRYVREEHIDNIGKFHVFEYLWDGLRPAEDIIAERVPKLEASLQNQELDECVAENKLTTNYLTKTVLITLIRELYRQGEKETLVRLAKWLRSRIQTGDFTEDQVRTAFGMDTTQWEAFKTRMLNLVSAYDFVQAARGE